MRLSASFLINTNIVLCFGAWFHQQQPPAQRMVASSKVIRVGPLGGRGGSPWDDDGPHRGVRSITVAYGQFLESMTVEYVDRNGRPFFGEKHGGGASRSRTEKVTAHLLDRLATRSAGRLVVSCSYN
jgi:hypothetical protein